MTNLPIMLCYGDPIKIREIPRLPQGFVTTVLNIIVIAVFILIILWAVGGILHNVNIIINAIKEFIDEIRGNGND